MLFQIVLAVFKFELTMMSVKLLLVPFHVAMREQLMTANAANFGIRRIACMRGMVLTKRGYGNPLNPLFYFFLRNPLINKGEKIDLFSSG